MTLGDVAAVVGPSSVALQTEVKRMFGKAFAIGAVALMSLAFAAGPSFAIGEIGNVHIVKVWAYGTPVK